ncbi:hypothetical protein Pcinc_017145 [Petrolisthes cinctipes]|uniref:Uncharacterized protein n=1 Tax=Petrolisthes cinctipes TaxID=88211 RepID=A0AAE1KL22_PETCI|nr:hypothetical protein Pcinc_017145 [Petrolisthes cinctipes]
MKPSVGCVLVWMVVGSLLGVGVLSPPECEAAAAPAPVPCCGRGKGAAFGLGFVGGLLIGRHRRRWHGGGGGGCGGGGCGGGGGGCGGGGCGWCGGCGYGRKRRSLDEVIDTDQLEEIFFKIAREDKDECGLRLVCELASKESHQLSEDEIIYLLPYRGREESDGKTSFGKYDKAVWHGQKSHPCHKLYSLCPYPATSIIPLPTLNATVPY